jgi:hypothetical protein
MLKKVIFVSEFGPKFSLLLSKKVGPKMVSIMEEIEKKM